LPRCTPSAPVSAASSRWSFTIRGTRRRRHTASSAATCSRRTASVALLLRYCTRLAPPRTAASTMAARRAVSGSSGVTAYSPRMRMSVLVVIVPGPEHPVGDVLSHSGAKALAQALPGELLCIAHRFLHCETVGKGCGHCRREGAARAVVGAGEALPGVGAHHPI